MMKAVGLFLLLLLKILGWTLLILLLFFIAVLLFVLFVPVRYDVRVQNERSMEPGRNHPAANLRLQLKATWLLHLLHVTVSYGPEGMQNKIRAAGIDIPKMLAYFAKRKEIRQKRREAKKRKSAGKKTRSRRREEAVSGKRKEESGGAPFHTEADQGEGGKALLSVEADAEAKVLVTKADAEAKVLVSEDKAADDIEVQIQSVEKSPETGAEAHKTRRKKGLKRHNARKTPKPKAEKRRRRPKKEGPGIFQKARTQLGRLHKEVTDETNRHAVSCLWKELLRLLQSYKPRKLKADLAFSLADPALTGGVTGIISLMPLIYRYPCSIIPDFTSEKLYIEGEIQAGGKVAVYVFLLSLLRLLRDKKFMGAVRRLLKRSRA